MAITPPDPPSSGAERASSRLLGPESDGDRSGGLVTREVEAMAAAWRRGERPLAEEFLGRHPGLDEEDAVRIVYEEACLRQEAGLEGASTEILGRFPRWRSKLALLLDGNRLLRSAPEADFPEVGEILGDFLLVAAIGRGAVGRTFLASQRSLADRAVVLKVTALGHEEHLSLARLQHMHIVPLYFEQVVAERNLRVLCMPYLGGATLARIVDAHRAIPAERRSGRTILDALDRSATGVPTDDPPGGPFRKYLARASYVQSVSWIGACLADALQYAHDRGLVHMDVKPSNVLLAGDGQPMLLDFHLARGPVGPDRAAPDRLGGTPGFMAPEQRAAMAAIREGRAVPSAVDGRSDLYSLGLLLYELLGDGAAPGEGSRRPLDRTNPRVSPGLSDIVEKCLAHDPGARYPDAAALAIDLRRHLNDQPLRGVANRSPAERWRKWRRRQPEALPRVLFRLAAVVAVVVLGAGLIVQSRQRGQQVDALWDEGREHLKNHQYDEAKAALDRALRLAGDLPPLDGRTQELALDLVRVRRARTAAELHGLVDVLRFRTGIQPPTADEARSLFGRGLEIWKLRALLTDPGGDPLDEPTEQQIRTDLLDLATICADLRLHWEDGDASGDARREAARLLLDAEAQFGPNPALSRDLAPFRPDPGGAAAPPATIPTPTTAWEHYDLGRSYLRSGEHALAEAEFQRAVELDPGEFWPNFFRGVCAYRLRRYQDAVTALSICVALAPKTAECYYNRGVVYEALGQEERAHNDYSRALTRNPNLTDAALNRGVLRLRRGWYPQATHDFQLARSSATSPRTLGLIYYNLALVQIAQKDPIAARADLKRAIESGNEDARALDARLGLK